MKFLKAFWGSVGILTATALLVACGGDNGKAAGEVYLPEAPDYTNPLMWYTESNDADGTGADVFYVVSTWEIDWKTGDGRISHWADVWNAEHRDRMKIEISGVAQYMGEGNRFYAPYYRHTTIEAWLTRNEDTVTSRTRPAMQDVKDAFDYFLAERARTGTNDRPLIIAGFSQGGRAVVELLKHMDDETYRHLAAAYVLGYKVTPQDTLDCARIKPARDSADIGVTICYNTVKDVQYIQPVVAAPCAMCINPVNWRTDSVPATLHDTITVAVSPAHHVLVVKGYEGSEYAPIYDFLNVGDIHSCEPWLYQDCLKRNMQLRTRRMAER